MMQRDYLVRQISQMTQALVQVVLRIQKKEYDEALDDIQQAGQTFLGLDMDEVAALDIEHVRSKVGGDVHLVAELFMHQGTCFDAQGHDGRAEQSYVQALRYYLDASEVQGAQIDALLARLDVFQLSAEVQREVLAYLESMQRFGEAEDLLFVMAERGEAVYDEGIAFYERLLRKSYRPLREGNLPWEEVREGKAVFEERFGPAR